MTHQVLLQGVSRRDAPALKRGILHALAMSEAGPGSLTLRVTDEAELRRLNAQYAASDHATDVLSFADGNPNVEGNGVYFGDVVIALPIADAHARAAGHDVQSELLLLAIHGTLHLLGFDHDSERSRDAMWRRQDQILADVGCLIRSPQGEA
jgi:probable rRNA maturation factor